MSTERIGCSQPWFYDPGVQRKLMKLIKTDVVRIMDKTFMNNLQEKLYQSHWADFEERLAKRRRNEAERRKTLALRGVQQLDDNSLDQHPIIQVGRKVEEDLEVVRKRMRKPRRRPHVDPWEYRQFVTLSDLESEPSEVCPIDEDIPDLDWQRRSFRKFALMKEEAEEIGHLPAPEVMDNLKYEPALVKQLRDIHTVQELYSMAERILAISVLEPVAPPAAPAAPEAAPPAPSDAPPQGTPAPDPASQPTVETAAAPEPETGKKKPASKPKAGKASKPKSPKASKPKKGA